MGDRQPERIEDAVYDLLAQRGYGLCLGYEDLHDHDPPRANPRRRRGNSIASSLMQTLRRSPAGTELAQAGTLRLQPLQIGAQVPVTGRRGLVALCQSYPLPELWAQL